MTFLIQFSRINDVIATSLGMFANAFLMYLIFTVNQSSMKQISRTLLQNSILDFIMAAVLLICEPQIITTHGIYYNIIGSPLHVLGFKFAGIIVPLFGMTTVSSIQAMPIPFYIRYLLLCKNTSVTFRHLIGPYSVVFLYSIALLISLLFCYPPMPEVYEPYKAALNNSFWLDEYPGGPVFAAKPPNDPTLIIAFCMIFFAIFVSYLFVLYYAIKITRHLKQSQTQMSERTKTLNKQLHLTLIIQAIGPLLSGNLPVLILVTMSLFTLENHYISLGCCSILVWTAIINPLAAMIIINPYRKRIKEMLRIRKADSIGSSAVWSSPGMDTNRITASKMADLGVPAIRNNTLEPINMFLII